MKTVYSAILVACIMLLASCGSSGKAADEEDLVAKQMFQGIWLDEETGMPLVRCSGDSLFHASSPSVPVTFKIVGDTLYLQASQVAKYVIKKQTETDLWLHTPNNDLLKLCKSEDEEDIYSFYVDEKEEPSDSYAPQVLQKDSVVMYAGTRYRGYVYINPTQMKVVRTTYSEGGIAIENVYYDNIIYICVYQGKEELYGKDISKKDFAGVLQDDFLSQAILSDMNFTGVDSSGYHYQAVLSVPESPLYSIINLVIGFDKEIKMKKAE